MSREIFDEIKRRVRLPDYLSSKYGVEIKNGNMARCPFHEEKTASFHVINDQNWHCFGCNESGSVIDVVMKKQGLPLMDAVRVLAQELNIQLSPQDEAQMRAYRDLQERTGKMLSRASQDLSGDLLAETYLEGRKLSAETIKHFGLGYRPDVNGISIPIKDHSNHLVGYSVRMLAPKDREPKYKNSPDSNLFHKREILYNLGACRAAVKEKIYICEGYFDTMALHQMGFFGSVAICQAVMTKEQAKVLHEVILPSTEVVFVPDNDRPGIEALVKNVALLRAYSKERSIRVATMPGGAKDASEAMQVDPQAAKDAVNSAEQAELALLKLMVDAEPDQSKQYQAAAPVLASVSPLLRDDLLDYLSRIWGKDKKLLASYFGGEVKEPLVEVFTDSLGLIDAYTGFIKHAHAHGVHFGMPGLDRMVRRVAPGEVVIIQARPGVGKTALGINLLSCFSKQNHTCLAFSLEMQKEPIFERMVQVANNLSGHEVERMTMEKSPKLRDIHSNYWDAFKNVHVCDKAGLTLQQMRDYITHFAATEKFPQIVMVDFFGYIRATEGTSLYEKASSVAKELKTLAKDLNNQWVVLSQINRSGGNGGEPVGLDASRDSGSIEEVADLLIGLWRPELEKEIDDDERAKRETESAMMAGIIKNRSGPTGVVKLAFNRRTLAITDFEGQAPAPPKAAPVQTYFTEAAHKDTSEVAA